VIRLVPLLLAAAAGAGSSSADSAGADDPAARRAAVEKAAGEVLADPRYGYCHDAKYPLYMDEAGWCASVPDPSARCPDLPRVCKGDAIPARETRGGQGKPNDEVSEDSSWFHWPGLAGAAQVLLWIVLGGALAAIVFAIVRSLGGGRDRDEPALKPSEAAAEVAAAMRGPIETDVERLLALARAHAERGDFDRALDFLYAALLRRLEGDGLIRVRPWRTNGDYLRDLRARGDLHASVRAIVREIERVQFGAAQASSHLYSSLLDRVTPLVTRVLAVVSLAVVLGALASCSSHRRGAWDDSPSGSRAVLDLLGKTGFDARLRLKPLDKLGDDTDVVVLMPGARVDAAGWDKLLAWVRSGHTVFVANGSTHVPPALGVDLRAAGAPENVPARVAPELVAQLGDLKVAVPDRRRLILKDGVAAPLLLRGETAYAAWTDLGDGQVLTFADERLFTNVSLAVADNATFLVAALDEYGKRVDFVDEATGAAASSPAASLSHSKLAPLTLQIAFLLSLFFVHRGAAFGTLRDPPSATRRNFADHARALGLQYEKAHATRQALSLYAAYALDRMRDLAQPGNRGGLSMLAEAIARRTGRPLGAVMRVLVEAKGARDEQDPRTASAQQSLEDLALMRELGQLMKDIGGTREHRRRKR
jgi:Domain of unknown function (DUF4350)/Domain of unknown function (DUF4129)